MQKPRKYWESSVACFCDMSLSFVPWTIKQGLSTSFALSLLSNLCLRSPEARVPYRSLTASQRDKKGLKSTRPPTAYRLETWRAGPEPIDLPITMMLCTSKPTSCRRNYITSRPSLSIESEHGLPS